MKKILFVLVAALALSGTASAQMSEKELKKAQKVSEKVVKDAKEQQDKADGDKNAAKRLIDQAIKDPLVADWYQTWLVAANVYQDQFYLENLKLYNQQNCDTVLMYKNMLKWFDYAFKADSLEQIPNSKGKTTQETRKKHSEEISRNVSMLISAGIFYFNRRGDFATAYDYFELFFKIKEHPMLAADMEGRISDGDMWTYAYYDQLCAYKVEKWNDVIRLYDLASQDTTVSGNSTNGEYSTEFVVDAYGALKDTANWLKTLKEGLMKYPTVDYYYDKLLSYYSKKGDTEELEKFAKEMIEADPEKSYNYFILGVIYQQGKNFEAAVEQYKQAIAKDENLKEAYNNLGICYIEMARAYMQKNEKVSPRDKQYKTILENEKQYYRDAMPIYEKYRELAPDDKMNWGMRLYEIYYKLNMTKEFNEMDKLLESMN
ncbi:MAG: DUF2225 domain-containing protein [Bacteroidaceae bacterium]|nr:DUF2225 domain-containing protein [Bacteroidaceae bacterium]